MKLAYELFKEMVSGRFWPVAAASVIAWLILIASSQSAFFPELCLSAPIADLNGRLRLVAAVSLNGGLQQITSWVIMLLAMMTPLVWQPLVYVWERSLRGRQGRAVILFLAAYFGTWMVAVTLLAFLAVALRIATGGAFASFAAAISLAVIWQLTPVKAQVLKQCHVFRPLPAFGLSAEFATFRYGLAIGRACIASCWALMLVPLATDTFHILVMGLAGWMMLLERYGQVIDLKFIRYAGSFIGRSAKAR